MTNDQKKNQLIYEAVSYESAVEASARRRSAEHGAGDECEAGDCRQEARQRSRRDVVLHGWLP